MTRALMHQLLPLIVCNLTADSFIKSREDVQEYKREENAPRERKISAELQAKIDAIRMENKLAKERNFIKQKKERNRAYIF